MKHREEHYEKVYMLTKPLMVGDQNRRTEWTMLCFHVNLSTDQSGRHLNGNVSVSTDAVGPTPHSQNNRPNTHWVLLIGDCCDARLG